MKHIITSMTQRGQVTIPVEIRHKFGLKPGDKVMFTIEDGQVTVEPVKFSLEDAFASVQPRNRPEDIERLIHEAKDERAERLIAQMRSE